MPDMTTSTLMIAALAVMRDIRRAEATIAAMTPDDPQIEELTEDVLRMTKVLGEMQEAYRAAPHDDFPNWDDLVTLAAQD